MRMFIHGLKSLVRRPAKTLMLFLILFVVFNLIFTGFIIQNSIQKSKEYIRNEIGSAVEYRADFTGFVSAMQGQRRTAGAVNRPPSLSLAVAEKIAASPYVTSYFVSESANVSSDTIEPAETQQSGTGAVFRRSFSDFTLSGTNVPESMDFVMGNVKLVDGKNLSPANLTNGDEVVIISKEVAAANNLRVGDRVSLYRAAAVTADPGGFGGRDEQAAASSTTATTANAADYEVIGIYEALEDGFSVNTMFTSNTLVAELNRTAGSDDTNASIVYLLDSPNNVETFKTEASRYLTSEYHTLYSNDDEYESLTKPLNLLSYIASILIWIVFIAGAAIILAIVTIFVRDRKFEIGLLLSSGEGKIKVVSQFIFEMMVIALIAFLISVGSSNIAAKSVSGWIVDNQLLSQTSLIGSTNTSSSLPGNIGPGRIGPGRNAPVSVYGSVDMQNVANEFDVSVSASVMFKLMLAGVTLVLIGFTIPLTIIMGYNPKRILQDY